MASETCVLSVWLPKFVERLSRLVELFPVRQAFCRRDTHRLPIAMLGKDVWKRIELDKAVPVIQHQDRLCQLFVYQLADIWGEQFAANKVQRCEPRSGLVPCSVIIINQAGVNFALKTPLQEIFDDGRGDEQSEEP